MKKTWHIAVVGEGEGVSEKTIYPNKSSVTDVLLIGYSNKLFT